MVQLVDGRRAFCAVDCVIEAFGHYSSRSKEMGEEHGLCFRYTNFGKLLDCSLIIQLYICKFAEALAILIGCNGPYPSFQVWIWLISDDFCQLFFFSLVDICRTYITYLFLNHTITYILSRVIFKPDDFVMGSSGKKPFCSCKRIHPFSRPFRVAFTFNPTISTA